MKDTQGFTLMEALVALAVFATAAMGLISLNTSSIRISSELEARTLARQVAENIAVDTVTDPQAQIVGSASGEEIQRRTSFVWERQITPAPREDMIEVTIRVRSAGAESVLSQISFYHRIENGRNG